MKHAFVGTSWFTSRRGARSDDAGRAAGIRTAVVGMLIERIACRDPGIVRQVNLSPSAPARLYRTVTGSATRGAVGSVVLRGPWMRARVGRWYLRPEPFAGDVSPSASRSSRGSDVVEIGPEGGDRRGGPAIGTPTTAPPDVCGMVPLSARAPG